jgi:hypothetical protein
MNDTAPKNNTQEGKPQLSLIPLDVITKHVVPAYMEGVIKYERESWRRGFKTSVLVDAALRHITAFFYDGEDYDKDAEKLGIKKHHLGGAIFSLLSILHTLDTRPDLDDRAREQKPMVEEDKPKDGRMTQQFMDSPGPWWPRYGDPDMIKCESCGALKPTNTMCKCGW